MKIKNALFIIALISLSLLIFQSFAFADVNEDLIAYYPFDGNANDASGNGNDGVEYGGLTYEPGVVNSAARFDGIDDWIEVASSPELEMGSNSFRVFVRLPNKIEKKVSVLNA